MLKGQRSCFLKQWVISNFQTSQGSVIVTKSQSIAFFLDTMCVRVCIATIISH